jgi:DNA-binding transcriptional ArsR family regulator
MGLLDGFEKLINEHGSAVILKERIALANDKYAVLEQKLAASCLRVSELDSENQSLRADLEKAKVEIQNLKALSEKAHGNRIEEVKEQLLQLLAKHSNATYLQLARGMEINVQLVMFHLAELEKAKFVHGSYSAIDDTEWSLAHEGRAYLVRHGLLA